MTDDLQPGVESRVFCLVHEVATKLAESAEHLNDADAQTYFDQQAASFGEPLSVIEDRELEEVTVAAIKKLACYARRQQIQATRIAQAARIVA